jgi:hypothetical protein
MQHISKHISFNCILHTYLCRGIIKKSICIQMNSGSSGRNCALSGMTGAGKATDHKGHNTSPPFPAHKKTVPGNRDGFFFF